MPGAPVFELFVPVPGLTTVTEPPPGEVTPLFAEEPGAFVLPADVPGAFVFPGAEFPFVTFVFVFPFPPGEENTLPAEPPSITDASFWQTPFWSKV